MFLIRKYAVDKASGDALLAWLQPFETLIYKREGDWRDLAAKNKLTKAVIPKSDSAYGQDLIDKMVLLIKEELHHFYQVLETSDLPAGVLNIITGSAMELGDTLSKHNDVDAVWAFGTLDLIQGVEENSAGNLKRIWSGSGRQIDWLDPKLGEGDEFLRHATDIKNIWVPYGE